MTVKEFFRSEAFKSVAVLMTIVIICGGVIAVCNGLFAVSPEEMRNRAISKIYGGMPERTDVLTIEENNKVNEYGSVDEAYFVVFDGQDNALIKATGKNGYKGGTITLWVVIQLASDSSAVGINRVQYDSNTGQTLMSNFGESFYLQFTQKNADIAAKKYFSADKLSAEPTANVSVQSGASFSSKAIINAVNAALHFAYEGGISHE